MMKRQTYAPGELTKCPEPLNGATLKSGGPIMAGSHPYASIG
jgi:hypothetical protein